MDPIFDIYNFPRTENHRSNCPNASRLLVNYGYRVLKTEWEDDPRGFNTEFSTAVSIGRRYDA
ncbi:MAG: hypothetical protein IPL23_16270 [Saprospiraceae bacterium]|nr:hypothetical protein [Saprospiraceae bacterium]